MHVPWCPLPRSLPLSIQVNLSHAENAMHHSVMQKHASSPLPSSGQLSALAGMFYELANWVGTTVFLGCYAPSSLVPPRTSLLGQELACSVSAMRDYQTLELYVASRDSI